MLIDFYILTSGNLNSLDGASRFCKILSADCKYWENRGIKIITISNSSSFQNAQNYSHSLKHILKQRIKKILELTIIGKNLSFFNYNIGNLGKNIVNRLPKELNPDSWVLINDINVAANYYEKYGDKYNTIFMMHNSGEMLSMLAPLMDSYKIETYLKRLEVKIYKSASKLMFVSKYSYEVFKVKHPEYQNKCDFIYNGMPDISYDLDKRDYSKLKLVTIGTVGDRKNQIAAIKAIKEIRDKNLEFVVVGGGPKLKECINYVKENRLTEQIKMVGPQSDVKPFLQEANAFIMTSKDEGLPVAATEALCAALPIVITNVGGCKDLIENNGMLIEPNEKSIKQGIQYLLNNVDRLKDMGAESRRIYMRNFTERSMVDKYINIILG